MPRVSFLLPVRDGEHTIDAAISSCLTQTESDLELVIVNDGSQDSTPERLDTWARRDPRVRVLHRSPQGLVSSLNEGLDACRSPLVARMDADDITVPQRLSRQLPMLDLDPKLVAVDSQVHLFRDHGEVPPGMQAYAAWLNQVVEPHDFDRELLVESPIIHPAVTFRREAVRTIGGYRDGPFPEDYDLWLRLHAEGWCLAKVPEVLLHMRDRPDRLTRTHPRYGREAFRNARQTWFRRTVLSEPRSVAVLGAGRSGGAWLRWLQEQGHSVSALLDISPRRIGRTRQGIRVQSLDALPEVAADIVIVAVGARPAREALTEHISRYRPDWNRGSDLFFVGG